MTDVTVKEQTAVAVPGMDAAWGAEDVSSKDVLVPRIMLTQQLSELVKNGKAMAGTIVSSSLNEILASAGQSLEIIPIKTYREWVENTVETGKGGKDKESFKRIVPMTRANENWPTEEIVDGEAIRRHKSLNFFVVIPGKLDSLPHVVQFRKTSYRTGQQLATHFKMSELQKKTPARQVFALSAVSKSWEGYDFFVLEVEAKRAATQDELNAAYNWYRLLSESNVSTDEVMPKAAGADEAPSFS